LYAGRIAQAKYAGREITWGYGQDDPDIADLVTIVSYWDEVSHAYLVYCEKRAKLMVESAWPEIQAVAHALAERKSLTGRQVREVIASIPLDAIEEHRIRQGDHAVEPER
jgi:hypothetical protein